ncbi:hypothetical protein CR513_57969, partial [Mucuna pruriens]
MLGTWTCRPLPGQRTPVCHISMALLHLGDGHLRPVPQGKGHWLLHQMDQGRAVSHHHHLNLIYRYRLPYSVITDNGTQIVSNSLCEFYEGLGINLRVSSVKHPNQMNMPKSLTKSYSVEYGNDWEKQKGHGLRSCQASSGCTISPYRPATAKPLSDWPSGQTP